MELSKNKTLKQLFNEAWKSLRVIYELGEICSECHMQCELFRLLKSNSVFNNEFRLFVEPRISTSEGIVYPDFIIQSRTTENVVAVVELKYVPHSYASYEKDLATLLNFCVMKKREPNVQLSLMTDPITGEWLKEKVKLDQHITLIYCIITQLDAFVLTNHTDLWKLDGGPVENEDINYLQYVGAIPCNQKEDWKCL